MGNDVSLAIGLFVALLAVFVAVRALTKGKFEVRTPEIGLALVPVALWLFMTGKIKSLSVGDVKIESAFAQAVASSVSGEVESLAGTLPIDELASDPKGAISNIDALAAKGSEALSFRLGAGYYEGYAIEQYLEKLTRFPFLKYLVVEDAQGGFVCMADARRSAALVATRSLAGQDIAGWLNAGDAATLVARLPGVILRSDALAPGASRREALEKLEASGSEVLPVVDEAGRLVGIVHRGHLTASLVADIARELE